MEREKSLAAQYITYCVTALPRYSLVEALADNLASEFCQKLHNSICLFDEHLDTNLEVGLRLVAFGQAITFSVSHLSYTNPSLIHFYGRMDNDQPVELIQHVSQISFLLTAVPRLNPSIPKPPIGFICPGAGCTSDETEQPCSSQSEQPGE